MLQDVKLKRLFEWSFWGCMKLVENDKSGVVLKRKKLNLCFLNLCCFFICWSHSGSEFYLHQCYSLHYVFAAVLCMVLRDSWYTYCKILRQSFKLDFVIQYLNINWPIILRRLVSWFLTSILQKESCWKHWKILAPTGFEHITFFVMSFVLVP